MDWKYKRFGLERRFTQPPAAVAAATRTFVSGTLGWSLTETPEGFEARGYSFARAAIATFRVRPAEEGAILAVDLMVERASPFGFMLGDVGGYYDGQIRQWLAGVEATLEGRPVTAASPSAGSRLLSCLLLTAAVTLGFAFAIYFVMAPLIGLATGVLYVPGRGDADLTLHGTWARVVSAGFLAFDALIVYRIRRTRRRPGHPKILVDPPIR